MIRILKIHLWILIILIMFGTSINAENDPNIYIVFRFDDYSARSETELESKIINKFNEYDLQFTIGVIPFVCSGSIHDSSWQELLPLTPFKGEILKRAFNQGIIEVALHGYSHQTIYSKDIRSEFAGLDKENQNERIINGKSFLEKIIESPIYTFVPPWNSYDYNTLNILEGLEFKSISANIFGPIEEYSKLNYIPSTCSILDLKEAVESCRKSSDEINIIVALLHEYDFKEVNQTEGIIDFIEFSEILQWVHIQDDVKVFTVNELGDSLARDQLEDKYLINKRTQLINRFLPPLFLQQYDYSFAPYKAYRLSLISLFVYYIILFLLTIIINILLLRILLNSKRFIYHLKYISLVLLGLFIAFLFLKPNFGYYFTSVLVVLFAFNIVIWTKSSILNRK